MHHRVILIPIVFCLLSLSCSFFSSSSVTNTAAPEPSSPIGPAYTDTPNSNIPPAASTLAGAGPIRGKMGDVITNNTMRVVVHGWSIVAASFNVTPKPGDKLLNVDFTVVNIGTESLSPGDGEWRLVDADGNAYESSGYDESGHGELFPGERIHVSRLYEVPENSNGFVLDFGMWIDGKYITNPILFPYQELLVDLGSQPVMGALDVEIPGEVMPTVESMDSAVTCGDWTLQVLHVREQMGSNFIPILPEGVLHFVLGEITMTYQGTDTGSILSSIVFWMQDPTGLRFSSYPAQVADMGSVELDGSYAPGEQKTGIVGFGVPVNWSPMWLVFWCGGQASPTQAQKVFVSIPSLER